ncbi:MAG: nucleotidyltransferase domain-containing protein [Candidatus Nanoarchaeia archaeon]|nr:nucleotidyltransferase domain-containing protein [Candidatus Nanoarchaeia archaeon]
MVSLTLTERECLLVLFKEFTAFYNANSISKILDISHVGAQKLFKRLFKENLVISRQIGKSINYRLNFEEAYVSQLIAFLLADEANSFKRWKEEFKEVFKEGRIVMIYGSAIKNYVQASDIDIMVVMNKNDIKEINKFINKKEEMLPKKLHAIMVTQQDLLENLKKRNKAIIDIVKNAIVLYGQDKYVEIMKDAARF